MNTTFKFGNFEHEFNTADWRTTEKHEKAHAGLVTALNGRQKDLPPSAFQRLLIESIIKLFEDLFDDAPDVANQLFGPSVDVMLAIDALDTLNTIVREQDAVMAGRFKAFAMEPARKVTGLPGKSVLR